MMIRKVIFAGLVLLAACAAPVAAQSTPTAPGYYDNSSGSADSGAWLAGMEDASLEDILERLKPMLGQPAEAH
jgi:hypothetical protein